jgi:hypothetical protein
MATNMETAEKVKEFLEKECILVKVRPVQKCSCGDGYYEILVPESEIEEVKSCLYQAGL